MIICLFLVLVSAFSSFVQTTIGFGCRMVAVVLLLVLFESNADASSMIRSLALYRQPFYLPEAIKRST